MNGKNEPTPPTGTGAPPANSQAPPDQRVLEFLVQDAIEKAMEKKYKRLIDLSDFWGHVRCLWPILCCFAAILSAVVVLVGLHWNNLFETANGAAQTLEKKMIEVTNQMVLANYLSGLAQANAHQAETQAMAAQQASARASESFSSATNLLATATNLSNTARQTSMEATQTLADARTQFNRLTNSFRQVDTLTSNYSKQLADLSSNVAMNRNLIEAVARARVSEIIFLTDKERRTILLSDPTNSANVYKLTFETAEAHTRSDVKINWSYQSGGTYEQKDTINLPGAGESSKATAAERLYHIHGTPFWYSPIFARNSRWGSDFITLKVECPETGDQRKSANFVTTRMSYPSPCSEPGCPEPSPVTHGK